MSGTSAEPLFQETAANSDFETLRASIRRLPLLSPQQIAQRLEQLGYKGQADQCHAMALMAYRHVRRLKRIYLEGVDHRQLPPKQNTLLIGPTGCGKTFLVELLFRHIFTLPTVIIDITSYTESGYVGESVQTILTRLVAAAGGNELLASCGVVCLDEFDKIASSTSNARFAGEGTIKDVSGRGVQRELLKMLEGSDALAPSDYGYSAHGSRYALSTRDIPFVACGAFSGLEELLKTTTRARLGFHPSEEMETAAEQKLTLEEVEVFRKYGFMPEVIGRFARIILFPTLSEETLRRILLENVLPQFVNEFAAEGLRLTVTDAALDQIIACSLKRGTGARGLHTELVAAVERAAFETFGHAHRAEVVIDVSSAGRLHSEIRKWA